MQKPLLGYYDAMIPVYTSQSPKRGERPDDMPELKITHNVLRICSFFVRRRPQRLSVYDLSKALKTRYHVLHEAMGRMEEEGWLHSEMERTNRTLSYRPRRRLYAMTTEGEQRARQLLDELKVA